MFARGLKRKCDQEEGAESFGTVASYNLQRQSLLDMSLVKLQLCHMLVEPNLCRSVLIANTVQHIQEEMSRDGVWHEVAPQSAEPAPLGRLVPTEILCRPPRRPEGERPAPELGNGLLQDPASELSENGSAQVLRSPLSSLREPDNTRENGGGFQKSLDQMFDILEKENTSSMEELFSDMDASYYDPHYYDHNAVMTGVMTGTKQSLCEGLEDFAVDAPSPNSSCDSDLAEVDHLVEILVET